MTQPSDTTFSTVHAMFVIDAMAIPHLVQQAATVTARFADSLAGEIAYATRHPTSRTYANSARCLCAVAKSYSHLSSRSGSQSTATPPNVQSPNALEMANT